MSLPEHWIASQIERRERPAVDQLFAGGDTHGMGDSLRACDVSIQIQNMTRKKRAPGEGRPF